MSRKASNHFRLQRLTALANIPLTIAVTIAIPSQIGSGFQDAKEFFSSPLISTAVILLFVSALLHMRLGMQTVIDDYIHAPALHALTHLLNNLFIIIVGLIGVAAALSLLFLS